MIKLFIFILFSNVTILKGNGKTAHKTGWVLPFLPVSCLLQFTIFLLKTGYGNFFSISDLYLFFLLSQILIRKSHNHFFGKILVSSTREALPASTAPPTGLQRELSPSHAPSPACGCLQVLLPAGHPGQGGGPAAGLPVQRDAQEHPGDWRGRGAGGGGRRRRHPGRPAPGSPAGPDQPGHHHQLPQWRPATADLRHRHPQQRRHQVGVPSPSVASQVPPAEPPCWRWWRTWWRTSVPAPRPGLGLQATFSGSWSRLR